MGNPKFHKSFLICIIIISPLNKTVNGEIAKFCLESSLFLSFYSNFAENSVEFQRESWVCAVVSGCKTVTMYPPRLSSETTAETNASGSSSVSPSWREIR